MSGNLLKFLLFVLYRIHVCVFNSNKKKYEKKFGTILRSWFIKLLKKIYI